MNNKPDSILEIASSDDVIASSTAERADDIIPDRYLNRAIGVCCTDDYGRLLLSKPVRELITRYAPLDRPTMNAIPQQRRGQFLEELSSTTKRTLRAIAEF